MNHVFCSFVGVLKLECLKLKTGLNHFALKAKLRLKAVRAAQDELIGIRVWSLSLRKFSRSKKKTTVYYGSFLLVTPTGLEPVSKP